ncbi:MAG: germination protein YpeB [Oscillospiraceae bacterium]|nr:germination protein YpeB [Oscillospiraceae bacterium]
MSKRTMVVYGVICVVCLAIVTGLFFRVPARPSVEAEPAHYSELAAILLHAESAARACLYAGSLPSAAFECASVCVKSAEARIALARIEGVDHHALDTLLNAGFAFTQHLTKTLASGEDLTPESTARLRTYADTLSRICADIASTGAPADKPYPLPTKRNDPPDPHLLRGKREVTLGEAAAVAAIFAGLHRNAMQLTREVNGVMPRFVFSDNNGRVTVEVTKQGGFVSGMTAAQTPLPSGASPGQVTGRAASLLRDNGFSHMHMTQYQTYADCVTVTFAYSKDGVTYYPDEICVELTHNGHVTVFSSRAYITNRHERDLPKVTVTKASAESALSPLLTPESHKMAVITVDSEEVCCHEFKCVSESGETFFVYINAQSGQEDRIVRLYEGDACVLRV